MNNDLINRSDLKKELEPYRYTICGFEGVLALIDNAPTVKFSLLPADETKDEAYMRGYEKGKIEGLLKARPKGEWIKQPYKSYELKTSEGISIGEFTKCPKCFFDKARGSNYCPNCGADMRYGITDER